MVMLRSIGNHSGKSVTSGNNSCSEDDNDAGLLVSAKDSLLS